MAKMLVYCSFEIECGKSFDELQRHVNEHKSEIDFRVYGGELIPEVKEEAPHE
jgi:hypothetical protein